MSLGKRYYRQAFPDTAIRLHEVSKDAERVMLILEVGGPSTATGLVKVDALTAFHCRLTLPQLRECCRELAEANLLTWNAGEGHAYICSWILNHPAKAKNNWTGYYDELRLAPPCAAKDTALAELGPCDFKHLSSEGGSDTVQTPLQQVQYGVRTKEKKKDQYQDNSESVAQPPAKAVKAKRTTFQPPDLADVEAYFEEQNSTAKEAAVLYDHYASKGWKVGNAPMKDWQAAARNWIRRNSGSSAQSLFSNNAQAPRPPATKLREIDNT